MSPNVIFNICSIQKIILKMKIIYHRFYNNAFQLCSRFLYATFTVCHGHSMKHKSHLQIAVSVFELISKLKVNIFSGDEKINETFPEVRIVSALKKEVSFPFNFNKITKFAYSLFFYFLLFFSHNSTFKRRQS